MIKEKLQKIKEKLEEIVVPYGIDSGLILKSMDNPSTWNKGRQALIYKYDNFSELGDALVELHGMIEKAITGYREKQHCTRCFGSEQWCTLHDCWQDDPRHSYIYPDCEECLVEKKCDFCC